MTFNLMDVGYSVGSPDGHDGAQKKWLVRDITCTIDSGKLIGIVGPNGSGKTTLLKMLSGAYAASAGRIQLFDEPIERYTIQSLARQRAMLSQHGVTGFPFTAFEVVLMGAMPWRQNNGDYTDEEKQIATDAMTQLGATSLTDRIYSTLSGGEMRRVDLARLVAQQTPVILLDEPTNHLDVRHQMSILSLCRQWVQEGCTVVAALHDLNLAAHYADELMLLDQGRLLVKDRPATVLTQERMADVYGLDCVVWEHPSGTPWMVPLGVANQKTCGNGQEATVGMCSSG